MKEQAVKFSIASLGGVISAWTEQALPMIFIVIAAVILDYITGMLAAAFNGNLYSKKARKGILKKVSFLLMLGLGFLLDWAIPYFLENGLDTTMPIHLPFGLIICAWIVITEAISVLENLCKIDGVPVPRFLVKWLRAAEGKIDGSEDGKK